MLAMLTLIWGGWMYFKSSDDEAKLRGIRNELKVAKQELGDARAAYEEESKKCETLAGEIDTLKENAQELRKGITAKREEKKKLAAQERQEQLEAERKAREEAAEARREKLRIQKEKEQAAEYEKEERKERIQQLKRRIESSTRGLESYSSCSAYAPPGKKDFGQVEKMRQNWTSFVRSCIEAVDKGDSKRFESTGKKLLNTAKALDRICDGRYVSDATNFVAEGRKILGAKKELQELEKLNKSE